MPGNQEQRLWMERHVIAGRMRLKIVNSQPQAVGMDADCTLQTVILGFLHWAATCIARIICLICNGSQGNALGLVELNKLNTPSSEVTRKRNHLHMRLALLLWFLSQRFAFPLRSLLVIATSTVIALWGLSVCSLFSIPLAFWKYDFHSLQNVEVEFVAFNKTRRALWCWLLEARSGGIRL